MSSFSLLNRRTQCYSNMHCNVKSKRKGSETELLGRDVREHWEISDHCSSLLFPAPYPDIQFETPSCNYYYLLHASSGVPDKELVKSVRVAHSRVLGKLNLTGLQVNNFILPVQIMKLKFIDPYSRQRIIEELCIYLSSQTRLRNVVLEQAAVSFDSLCRLLLALSQSHVRRLYLWNVLDKCEIPFKGPLQTDTNLDNLPRIPYTYNPGGRKYLKRLEKLKHNGNLNGEITSKTGNSSKRELQKILAGSELLSQLTWMEWSDGSLTETINYNKLLNLSDSFDSSHCVFTEMEAAVQCNMSQEDSCLITHMSLGCSSGMSDSNRYLANEQFVKTKINSCKHFLKIYENSQIKIETLREIYMIALNGLTNLTTLSLNYSLLADGSGASLLSIGSVMRGKLTDLELLCQIEDLPSPAHQQYDQDANHAIPDIIWKHVKKLCEHLKVHIVCVSMSCHDITKMFITRSIPLYRLHLDNGFCPTLRKPQINFYSTLKFVYLNFKETLEHISIVLWHSTGRIDSSLEKLINEITHLHTFEYYGPIQYKATINNLCDAALLSSSVINFTLMVQGDPCYPHIAQEVTEELYQRYQPKFAQQAINFKLGTHY